MMKAKSNKRSPVGSSGCSAHFSLLAPSHWQHAYRKDRAGDASDKTSSPVGLKLRSHPHEYSEDDNPNHESDNASGAHWLGPFLFVGVHILRGGGMMPNVPHELPPPSQERRIATESRGGC